MTVNVKNFIEGLMPDPEQNFDLSNDRDKILKEILPGHS